MEQLTLLPDERLDEVNFRIRLIQKKHGLNFGTDALLLASYIKSFSSAHAVELGGGSGIVSLLCLARDKVAHVDCVEVQSTYATLIERNIKLNAFETRMRAVYMDVRSLAIQGAERGSIDIVFSNPPYMTISSGSPNAMAEKNIARHEVLGGIEDFCAAAARLLRYGGHFYCVYRTDRLADLFDSLRKNGLEPKRITFVHADTKAAPSMLLLDAVAGGKNGLQITRPLILYKKDAKDTRVYTDDMKQVMENGILPQAIER